MSRLLGLIHSSVPRRKADMAWCLALVARYRTTIILRDEPASFMEWGELAKIFGWNSASALSAHCRRRLTVAIDDSGLGAVNLLAPLRATISQEIIELTDQASSLAVDLRV